MSVLTQIDGGIGLAPRRMLLSSDGAARAALASAATGLGWDGFETCSTGMVAAVPVIDAGNPPALLVVDLDGEAEPLNALSLLADACLAQTRVLAIGSGNDVPLYRDLVAVGVSDYLVKPLAPDVLAAALAKIDGAAGDAGNRAVPAGIGRVVAVLGVRGGCGATTLATSLAWMIADRGESVGAARRCILVDFDLHFGSAAMALGVEPGPGLTAMLASPDRLDEHLIAASLQPVNDRFGMIAAQAAVESEAPVSPVAAMALVTALRQAAQWVVADLPRGLDATARQLLRTADQVVLVAPPSLEGLRDTRRLLGWLVALRAGAPPLVVVNGAGGGSGEISRKLFEETIDTPVAAWIPALCGPAAAAAAHALPLAALAGGAAAGRGGQSVRGAGSAGDGGSGGRAAVAPARLVAEAVIRAAVAPQGFGRRSTAVVAGALLPRLGLATASSEQVQTLMQPLVAAQFDPAEAGAMPRGALAAALSALVDRTLGDAGLWLDPSARRDLVSGFLAGMLAAHGAPAASGGRALLPRIHGAVMERIDSAAASRMGRGELGRRLTAVVTELLAEQRIMLNAAELQAMVTGLLDDMLGLGPLEPLLADAGVDDIMVNGPQAVFVERAGRLEATDVRFRDDAHVMAVAARIVAQVGRRIDEASPACRCAAGRWQPGQHHHPAAGDRWPDHLDPQILETRHRSRPDGGTGQHVAGDGDGAQGRGGIAAQHPGFGRHRIGQDDAAQCVVATDFAGRTDS